MVQTSCVLVMKNDYNVFKCSRYGDHVMKDYWIQKRLKNKTKLQAEKSSSPSGECRKGQT